MLEGPSKVFSKYKCFLGFSHESWNYSHNIQNLGGSNLPNLKSRWYEIVMLVGKADTPMSHIRDLLESNSLNINNPNRVRCNRHNSFNVT